MFTQNITSTKMSLFTGNHVEKNRRCCDSIRCCTIATMDYGTDPISSFVLHIPSLPSPLATTLASTNSGLLPIIQLNKINNVNNIIKLSTMQCKLYIANLVTHTEENLWNCQMCLTLIKSCQKFKTLLKLGNSIYKQFVAISWYKGRSFRQHILHTKV